MVYTYIFVKELFHIIYYHIYIITYDDHHVLHVLHVSHSDFIFVYTRSYTEFARRTAYVVRLARVNFAIYSYLIFAYRPYSP